jgi:hypothetical protein
MPDNAQTADGSFVRVLSHSPRARFAALVGAGLFCVFGVGLLAAVWIYAVPYVWHLSPAYEFGVVSSLTSVGAVVLALFAPVILVGIPFVVLSSVVDVYARVINDEVSRTFDTAREEQGVAESELAMHDASGLKPLVRYSRIQLESYYRIGLIQTQRSFRYSVIAMWFGFFVILAGIVYQMFSLDQYFHPGTDKPDLKFVTLVSGAIIEVIAALFLWVYRSSIVQLTYFYNRQMHLHNVIFCYRMASSMTSKDDTIRLIIGKVLDQTWTIDRPATPSGKVVSDMLGKKSS